MFMFGVKWWQFGNSAKTAYLAVRKMYLKQYSYKELTRSLTKKLLPIEKFYS